MKHGRIFLTGQNVCVIPQAMQTSNALERMRGLLGRTALTDQQALLIRPCSSVHTFGMRFALDLVYLRRDWTIRKLVHSLPPRRLSFCPGAAMVIEMRAGRIRTLGLQSDQQLRWES